MTTALPEDQLIRKGSVLSKDPSCLVVQARSSLLSCLSLANCSLVMHVRFLKFKALHKCTVFERLLKHSCKSFVTFVKKSQSCINDGKDVSLKKLFSIVLCNRGIKRRHSVSECKNSCLIIASTLVLQKLLNSFFVSFRNLKFLFSCSCKMCESKAKARKFAKVLIRQID